MNSVVRKPFYEEYCGGIRSEENDKVYYNGLKEFLNNIFKSKNNKLKEE